MRPCWGGVRLLEVGLHAEAMPGIDLHADEVRLLLRWDLHPARVEVAGARLTAVGTRDALSDQIEAWRHPNGGRGRVGEDGHRPDVVVDDASIRWTDGKTDEPVLSAVGVRLTADRTSTRFSARDAEAHSAHGAVAIHGVSVELTPAGTIVRAAAGAASLAWTTTASGSDASRSDRQPDASPSNATTSARASNSWAGQARRHAAAEPLSDPRRPLIAPPPLPVIRKEIDGIANLVSERLSAGATVAVDALEWKIVRPAEKVDLTIGPGPFSIERVGPGVSVRFSTTHRPGTTPLAFNLVLPLDGRDVSLGLDGGPVPLDELGIREGALGLVDVAHATAIGRARVSLAADGGSVTFDVDAQGSGLSLDDARLARDVVRDVHLALSARGMLTAAGTVRLDDFGASLGAIRLAGSGVLDQDSDHVTGAFHVEIPRASCQALVESVPPALLRALEGARIAGTFAARGETAFDTRSLDDLRLDYDVEDECKIVKVPPMLARDRFEQPFSHRVVLPDGTMGEQLTGPGTPAWTPIDEISPYMQVAVLTTEDGAFLRHHGFNRAAIRASIIANLKARRFVRGASTITMQLAKNLFLGREKTLSRKLEEVVLTEYLEQTFSKDELMELYLNVIEFGPAIYGVTSAADYYFGRTPAELNLAECLFLASLLPSPIRYGAMHDLGSVPEGWMRTLHTLMAVAHRTGRINDEELAEAERQPVEIWHGGDRPPARPPVQERPTLDGDDGMTAPPPEDPPDVP